MSARRRQAGVPGCIGVALLVLLSAPCVAQTARSGDDAARATAQLQQLSAERVQLRAENDALKQKLEEAERKLAQQGDEQQAAARQQSAVEQQLRVQLARLSTEGREEDRKTRQQLHELIARYREVGENLRTMEADASRLRSEAELGKRDLQACSRRNAALYQLSLETIDRLEARGSASRLLEREPFTGIARARLANLADDLRLRADEQQMSPAGGQAAEAARPQAARP
jgi:chromosome segregation ATPase